MSDVAAYGIMAEFATPAAVTAAARGLHLDGFRGMEA